MISKEVLKDILSKSKTKSHAKVAAVVESHDTEPDVSVGLHGVLAATEKLLAVNRGLVPEDERDNLRYKRVQTTDKLISERVRADADKLRLGVLRRTARARSLKGLMPFAFDGYATGHIVGNPLSSPLEEINPISLVEQQRRLTQMGPGGLTSDQSITPEAQNVTPSQMGFICPLSGPECFTSGTEVFTSTGWLDWSKVTDSTLFACQVNDTLVFERADRIITEPYEGSVISTNLHWLHFEVTPSHRMWFANPQNKKQPKKYRLETADHVSKLSQVQIDTGHPPYDPKNAIKEFKMPDLVGKLQPRQKNFRAVSIDDWCEFIGRYLAEGSVDIRKIKQSSNHALFTTRYVTEIAQSNDVNPDCVLEIKALLERLPFTWSYSTKKNKFSICGKQLALYLSQFGKCSQEKFIPEYLQHTPISARRRLLYSLVQGDGSNSGSRHAFFSTSIQLAKDVERLALGLGQPTTFVTEQYKHPEGKKPYYKISLLKRRYRILSSRVRNWLRIAWSTREYSGMVYCATVPGGLLYTRRGNSVGFWSGNSQRAGIDTRMAHGVKIGSDGNLYQKFYDKRAKKHRWVTPSEAADSVVKFPD